jgi:putative transposase
MHKDLYNAAVSNRKTQYQKFNHSVDYFEQQASLPAFKECLEEYKKLNAGSLQATLKRVDFAFVRFFKGLGKYPKFKSIRRYSGWTYPDVRQGFKVHSTGDNGYLELRDLGIEVQMRGKARTWGMPTTCTIVYRNGKWYASITVNCEPIRDVGTGEIGLDIGTLTAIACSDGTKIENPRFLAKTQAKICKASKDKRRKRAPNFKKKIKASKRWKKAQKKVSKLQQTVANQRQDWVHQRATEIVSGYSIVATEKLNLKNMTRKAKKGSKRKAQKTGLNRSVLDVGMGMFRQALEYKLSEAGGFLIEIPTQTVKPSQRCAKCWELTPKTLADRVHVCSNPDCQHVEDRDINSAQVCLIWVRGFWRSPPELDSAPARARGLERASSNVDESSSTPCGSMAQLAQMKRQKRAALRSSSA